MRDVGKAAKDWPQLNFIIYHSASRWAGGGARGCLGAVRADRPHRVGLRDLAEIPAKYGVTNVYGDLGQIFAQSTSRSRACARR